MMRYYFELSYVLGKMHYCSTLLPWFRFSTFDVKFCSVSRQQPHAREWRQTETEWLLQQDGLWAQRVPGLLLVPGQQSDLGHGQRGQLGQHGDELLRLLARQHLQVREKTDGRQRKTPLRQEKGCVFSERLHCRGVCLKMDRSSCF